MSGWGAVLERAQPHTQEADIQAHCLRLPMVRLACCPLCVSECLLSDWKPVSSPRAEVAPAVGFGCSAKCRVSSPLPLFLWDQCQGLPVFTGEREQVNLPWHMPAWGPSSLVPLLPDISTSRATTAWGYWMCSQSELGLAISRRDLFNRDSKAKTQVALGL